MPITIALPDEILVGLQRHAEAQHRSVEELAVEILTIALTADVSLPTPEEVVAKIRATPPNPRAILPASDSLAEALRNAPSGPDFDVAVWQRQWAAAEAEMRGMTRANDLAEGRG